MGIKFSTDLETSWGDYRTKLIDLHTGDWRTTRPVLDKNACRHCGLCVFHCPVGCIKTDADGYYRADLYYCKGCGVCASICPANALSMIMEEEARKDD